MNRAVSADFSQLPLLNSISYLLLAGFASLTRRPTENPPRNDRPKPNMLQCIKYLVTAKMRSCGGNYVI